MKLEDLKLYQECLNFEQQVWNVVNSWEGFNKDTIGKSFVEAADAISGNIADGYGRYNFNDKKHYCYISRGHLLKTKGWLIKAKERELIEVETADELIEFVEKIHRMLNAYIRSIGRVKTDKPYENKPNYQTETSDVDGNATVTETTDEDSGNSFTASADEFFSSDELTNA